MDLSVSVLSLATVLGMTLLFSCLSLYFWHVQRLDHTPVWLAAWLFACAAYMLCRLLQYAPLSDELHILVPRCLLTAAFLLGWLGYELANSFINFKPPRWERLSVIAIIAGLIATLWATDLILTDQLVIRQVFLGGEFTGVQVGALYLPAFAVLAVVGMIPPVRLVRSPHGSHRENTLMAVGFVIIVLFSLVDFAATFLSQNWIRLSDFSYLPVAIFLGFIEVKRLGRLYQRVNEEVQERTEKLSQANESLRSEITGRQRVEEELKAYVLRLSALIEHLQMGILFEDDRRHIALANQGYCTLFDISAPASSLVGTDCRSACQAAKGKMSDPEGFIQRIEEIVSSMQLVSNEKLVLADGRHFERDYIPISVEEHLLGHLWQYRDITERIRAEEAVKSSEEQYRHLVEYSPFGVAVHIKGKIAYVNPTVVKLIGANSVEQVIGKPVLDFVYPTSRPAVIQRFRDMGEGRQAPLLEEKFVALDGRVIDVEVAAFPVIYHHQPAIQVVFHDVTQRKRVEEQLRRTAAEMTVLFETTHDLVIEQDLSRLLHTIVERAAGILNTAGGGLYLCEPERRQVRCVVSYNTLRDYTNVVLKYGEGSAGQVAETGQPLVIADYRTWDRRAVIYEQDQPFRSMLSVPICWQNQVIGIIHVLENTRQRDFTQDELQILTLFANQAAIAVVNARLFAFEQRRRQESAAIAEVGRDISASLHLGVVLEKIATHARELLHTETGAVYLPDPTRPILVAIAAIGPDAEEIKNDPLVIGEGILGNIAAQENGEIVNNTSNDARAITIIGTDITPNEHLMGVPILSKNKLTGLIAVWRSGEGNDFSSADLDFLMSLGQQAAIAIENARLFEAEQNRRQEAETLRDAAQRITSTLDQDQVIVLILEQLAKVVPYESISVQLMRDGYLEIIAGQGWANPGTVIGLKFPIPGDNPNSLVIQERRLLRLGNVLAEYPSFRNTGHNHIKSWMGVPLIVRDRIIGMLTVDHSEPNFFSDADAQMVSAFANQAAIAIENTRLFEETQKRLREIDGLANASAALSRTLELEPLLETVLQSAMHAIPAAERGSILLASEDNRLNIRAVWGYTDPRIRNYSFTPDEGYATLALQERRPIVVPDVRAEARIRYTGDIAEMQIGGSAIAAPLIVKDNPIGVIAIDTPQCKEAFNEDDMHLLAALASPAALAIENARLFEDTRQKLAELEIMQTIASALRIAQSPDEAVPIILDLLVKLLDVGSAIVEMVDPASGEIVSEYAQGLWTPIVGYRTPANAGISGFVIDTGKPYFTANVLADGLIAQGDLIAGLNSVAVAPIVALHHPIGTLWVGRHPPSTFSREEVNLLVSLGEMMGNTIQRMKLHEQTVRQADEIARAYDRTLEGWAKALELRDKETGGHSRRVTDLTMLLARRMGVPESKLSHIHRGVLLHDIGKMGVPDQILRKTGPLNEDEWSEMRKHPVYAYELLEPIAYLQPALDIPYNHHERWDGSGYPRGLKGKAIPLEARIFAVVDVWDALISDRPYRLGWSREKARKYISDQAGAQFDPEIVAIFLKLLDQGEFKESI